MANKAIKRLADLAANKTPANLAYEEWCRGDNITRRITRAQIFQAGFDAGEKRRSKVGNKEHTSILKYIEKQLNAGSTIDEVLHEVKKGKHHAK